MISSQNDSKRVKFSVKLDSTRLGGKIFRIDDNGNASKTSVYLTGSETSLGAWNPSRAIRLVGNEDGDGKTSSWTSKPIEFGNSVAAGKIQYRYFIGRPTPLKKGDAPSGGSNEREFVQILKWESFKDPRTVEKLTGVTDTSDHFGEYDGLKSISMGWLHHPSLSEIRFFLFDRTSVEISKSTTHFPSPQFKISLTPYVKKENDELAVESDAIILVGPLDDEEYRPYVIDGSFLYTPGKDLLCFRIRTSKDVERMVFKFEVSDSRHPTSTMVATINGLESWRGAISTEFLDSHQKTTGKFSANYLVIEAAAKVPDGYSTFEKTYARYWKRRPALDIGHRGMGKSYTREAKARENSIKSLNMAFDNGADFVEFDVQVTSDGLPVLFHDFHICIEDADAKLREVAFNTLTSNQLGTLNLHHAYDAKRPYLRSSINVVDRDEDRDDPMNKAFASLEKTFRACPPSLGFNIEIKYPMMLLAGRMECVGPPMNDYLDRILRVVMPHAGARRIVFSSFCPEVCMMLWAKQNRYPVFFLTQGVTGRYPPYASPLARCERTAIRLASVEGFMGVCLHSEELLAKASLIAEARKRGLVLWSWGDDLDLPENIDALKRAGIDGVIYDWIDERTGGKRNIFLK